MADTFEPAASGRAKCRGCGVAIAKGELRFGERLPNAFGEGEMVHWFHPACAAYKRPETMLRALAEVPDVPDRPGLERRAAASLAQRRLARIDGAERAKGNATCRQCREPIARGAWRIRLKIYDEGMFNPAGYIHIACREAYFETADIVEQVLELSPALDAAEREALRAEFAGDSAARRAREG